MSIILYIHSEWTIKHIKTDTNSLHNNYSIGQELWLYAVF